MYCGNGVAKVGEETVGASARKWVLREHVACFGGVRLGQWIGVKGMKMELLPRLGLGTICISVSCGGIALTRARV